MEKLKFFNYWDSFGLFDNIQYMVPQQFMELFEIARVLYTGETNQDASGAIDAILSEETTDEPPVAESELDVNRINKQAPLSNRLEIENYRTIHDLKKALPSELAQDDDVFNAKLFTRSLLVQKFYESEYDDFNPVTAAFDKSDNDVHQFDQKFYILLDRSRSMDRNMRSWYSKCIVAEFLKRKLKSRARLFFRTFDSDTGPLFKIKQQSDFPALLEEVLLTKTGGSSTNIQKAVYQAISDIEYDKELQKSEILVVTDGISKINTYELKERLGDIKLNILKIGIEPNISDLYDIHSHMKGREQYRAEGPGEGRRFSNALFAELASVAKRFIEIGDLNKKVLYKIDMKAINDLDQWITYSNNLSLEKLILADKVKLYKQAYMLTQYLKLLLKNNRNETALLQKMVNKLFILKQHLLSFPDVLNIIEDMNNVESDRFIIKDAHRALRRMEDGLIITDSKLTVDKIRRNRVSFTSERGRNKGRSMFLVLFVKIVELIKKIILFPVRRLFKL